MVPEQFHEDKRATAQRSKHQVYWDVRRWIERARARVCVRRWKNRRGRSPSSFLHAAAPQASCQSGSPFEIQSHRERFFMLCRHLTFPSFFPFLLASYHFSLSQPSFIPSFHLSFHPSFHPSILHSILPFFILSSHPFILHSILPSFISPLALSSFLTSLLPFSLSKFYPHVLPSSLSLFPPFIYSYLSLFFCLSSLHPFVLLAFLASNRTFLGSSSVGYDDLQYYRIWGCNLKPSQLPLGPVPVWVCSP